MGKGVDNGKGAAIVALLSDLPHAHQSLQRRQAQAAFHA